MRILVVNDSPAMRSFICRVIRLSGMPVTECGEASNGVEALAYLEQHRVDVLFSDINMPVMDGERLVAELHRRGVLDRTSVLVVSTDSTHTRVQRLLQLGAAGYLRKPFTPEDLRDALERIPIGSGVEAAQ